MAIKHLQTIINISLQGHHHNLIPIHIYHHHKKEKRPFLLANYAPETEPLKSSITLITKLFSIFFITHYKVISISYLA
jgi:hypothetical protein